MPSLTRGQDNRMALQELYGRDPERFRRLVEDDTSTRDLIALAAQSALTCDDAVFGRSSPNRPTKPAIVVGEAAPADVRSGWTCRPTDCATPSNAPSTSCAATAPSPPATTSATTSTAAPSTSPPSASGYATPSL